VTVVVAGAIAEGAAAITAAPLSPLAAKSSHDAGDGMVGDGGSSVTGSGGSAAAGGDRRGTADGLSSAVGEIGIVVTWRL